MKVNNFDYFDGTARASASQDAARANHKDFDVDFQLGPMVNGQVDAPLSSDTCTLICKLTQIICSHVGCE